MIISHRTRIMIQCNAHGPTIDHTRITAVPDAVTRWIFRLYGKQGLKHTSSMCLNRRLLKDMRDLDQFPTPRKLLYDGFFDGFRQAPGSSFSCGEFEYS